MDILTDLLSRARATGSLFAESTMHGRGGIAMPPESSQLALHLVSHGRLWLHGEGRVRVLDAGDVLLVRAPTVVAMTAGREERPTPLQELLAGPYAQAAPGAGVCRLTIPGDGAPAGLLCGAYALSGTVCERLLAALPPVVQVPGATAPQALQRIVQVLVAEISADAPGQQTALDRILDLLLVHVLRAHFAASDAQAPLWYLALGDPVVGASLRALHADPARGWTVASLAREAGLSRAAFARRFSTAVGEPPLTYLTGWRMALAKEALRREGSTLSAVAREVGYGSEYALSAAFSRHVGEPPSHWRSRARTAAG